jgi:hypothetical protein
MAVARNVQDNVQIRLISSADLLRAEVEPYLPWIRRRWAYLSMRP